MKLTRIDLNRVNFHDLLIIRYSLVGEHGNEKEFSGMFTYFRVVMETKFA